MSALLLDQEECWVIHEWVRRERGAPVYGQEHDLGFVQKLWRAILDLDDAKDDSQTIEVDFTQGELLQITRQVSTMIALGSRPIGREILRKTFAALMGAEQEEVEDVQIPDVFRHAYEDDSNNSPDDRPDEKAFPGRDLPAAEA